MEGPAFVKWIERTLIEYDIPKEDFYANSGISTANMSQWRTGDYNPSPRSVKKAEDYFAKKQKESPVTGEGNEVLKAIQSDPIKFKIAKWISSLDQDKLKRVEIILDNAFEI